MTNQDLEKYQWESSNASELREFLKTRTGLKLLKALAVEEPELLGKGETNEVLIRSGETRQHKFITSFLLTLTGEFHAEEEDSSSIDNYPSLTDDSKWDGDKLDDKPQQ
jgi:hypothetical protein